MSSESSVQNVSEKQPKKSNLINKLVTGVFKLGLVLVIVLCLVIGLTLTPWGTQAVVGSVNSLVDELTIDYNSGGVGSELHLNSVKWKQVGSQADIYNLRVSIQLSCVWKLTVCIDSLSTDKTIVQIQPSPSQPNSEPLGAAITLPVPVSIKNISLNKVSLTLKDTADIKWQKLTGKLGFYKRLRIENMQLHGFDLTTYTAANSSQPPQESFDWTSWQYQPISPMPTVLPIHFDVLAFNMSEASLHLAGQQNITLKKIGLKASGSKKKVQLQELLIEHQQGQLVAKGNIQLNGQFEHVFSVDANALLEDKTLIKLTLRSSGNINSVSSHVELIDTSLLGKTATPSKAKPLKFVMDFTAQPAKATLPVKMRMDWHHVQWPLVNPDFTSETGVIDIEGNLNALKMSVATRLAGKSVPDTKIKLSAMGSSTAQDKRFELNELLLETLDGQILSQGKLTFSEFIEWQGHSTIKHINPSVFWPEFVADINGQILTQANNSHDVWKAKLNKLAINGQWQGYPLSASGSVDFHQNDGLQLQALSLKNADNILLLDGSVSKEQILDIRFSLDAADLSTTLPQLAGTLNLVGDLSGSAEQPEISYELSGNEIFASEVFVQQAIGKGHLKWNEQKPVELTLELKGIQGISNQVDSAQIVLSGDAEDHHFELTTSGQSTSVNLSIQGQLNQTSWQGNWLTGDILSSYANLSLDEAFKIEADWHKQQYFIAPHCWSHSDNELCIKLAEFKENTLAWDVSLKEFDLLSVIRRLMPAIPNIQTKSRLDLDMSGDWNIDYMPNAVLSASLSPGDWTFSEQNNLKLTFDETLVKAQINQQSMLANISLSGNKIGTVRASIAGQSGVYVEPLNRPLQGELFIERFDLAAFKALVPQLDVLQGNINGQAQIDGTLGQPLLIGELTLANGALKDESLPVALSEIEQSISLKGQNADFKGSYKLGKGLGEMYGDIAWKPTLKGNLHISGEELEFDYQSMIKAKVSPNIHLMFEPNNLEIEGDVTIPYARVKVRELPKGSISPSKDVVLVETLAEQETSKQRLAMNVLLKVDPLRNNQVKLDAFGLTTDLQGQLKLQNNKSEIFGSGDVKLVNGRYRAYGQNLLIREGDILFTSSLDRPFLSIEAVRDPNLTADGVIAGLRVEGAAQNPKVSVFSEPAMEQQQALSYILTGRGLGSSSGDSQDTMLTNALLSLGLGQSENLISKVGNKLGFEDVNLEMSSQGTDTQLSLTGTIAPGVQLRYSVPVFDSVAEVAIRYELLPKLYLEAVSGLTHAIDIYYQFSIEGSQNKQVEDD